MRIDMSYSKKEFTKSLINDCYAKQILFNRQSQQMNVAKETLCPRLLFMRR
jgi:hypothetical protein